MQRLIRVLLAAVGLMIAFVIGRTILYTAPLSPLSAPAPANGAVALDSTLAVARLSEALRFATISGDASGSAIDTLAFRAFHGYLLESHPRIGEALDLTIVSGLSLLFRWPGVDPERPPLLLLAHQDVVPADSTEWTEPPFGGIVDDGFVWGRGSLDNKSSVMAILQAVERLLAGGFTPASDIYLAFGHDEEVGGTGAIRMAALLDSLGVRPGLILDEGGVVGHGLMDGLSHPIAVVGIAEKGFATVELAVSGTGGHSSMPPPSTAIGILAGAVLALESHPMPARIDGPTREMLEAVGPHMDWPTRIVFANRALFSPVLRRVLSASPGTNATIRTTTAATVIRGGSKENVLPSSASALINFRLLPGDEPESALAHVRSVLSERPVSARLLPGSRPASRVSPVDSEAYALLQATIRASFPYDDLVVAPYLMVGGSDARWYGELSENVFRFQPVDIPESDGVRLHGVNERITVKAYAGMIAFYERLIMAYEG